MVVPTAIPVTTPVVLTVPLAGVLLLHVPPGVDGVSTIVVPGHTSLGPVMPVGVGVTVTGFVT